MALFSWKRTVLVSLWLTACGAETADPGSDSSTHFFSRCDVDADCEGEYSCQCNRCTVACTSDDRCGGRRATCAPASAVLECALEGNVCAPDDVSQEPPPSAFRDGGPSEVLPAPSDETEGGVPPQVPDDAAPEGGAGATPAFDAGSGEPLPEAGVTAPHRDASPPDPVFVPEPVTPIDAGVRPEENPPESPCPGAPECEWVELPPLPAATRGHGVVEMDGTLYVFGGLSAADSLGTSSELYASTWAYDLDTSEWSPRAFMPVGAYMLAAHRVGDRILVQTGYGINGFVNALLAYDPATDSWSELAPMPSYRYIFTTGVVAERLFVIGGTGTVDDLPQGSQDWEYKDYVQVYDPESESWSSAAPEPEPTGGAASCTLGSSIYVFGGDVSNRTTVYDAGTDSWSQATPPPVARNAHACVTVGDAFYLLGGRTSSGGELAIVERYHPSTDEWTRMPDMPEGRQWFGAAVVDTDIFVVAGQLDTGGLLDSVWLHHTEE